jgi:hypothetical protein
MSAVGCMLRLAAGFECDGKADRGSRLSTPARLGRKHRFSSPRGTTGSPTSIVLQRATSGIDRVRPQQGDVGGAVESDPLPKWSALRAIAIDLRIV